MSSRYIEENVKRKLYAESMGRCMNPCCNKELFCKTGDMIEKAHIDAYSETVDNSFENLVLLCPNCHTNFDKNKAFSPEEVLTWKKIRKQELEKFFGKKYDTFEELEKSVAPILLDNKTIFENYYIKSNRKLWDKFEFTILANNRKLKMLFSANLNLIQHHQNNDYSNLAYIHSFMAHVDEFEETRSNEEKQREILFPSEINSIFGIEPITEYMMPSTEALELLIENLKRQKKFETIVMGIEHPFIQIKEEEKSIKVFLEDTPRLRQLYHNYECFKSTKVRLDSLNFALKYINSRNVRYSFSDDVNLREIIIKGKKMIFIYEYCLSQASLIRLSPKKNSIVVNLHRWNGKFCISEEAYELAKHMNVKLLTTEDFYEYINNIK